MRRILLDEGVSAGVRAYLTGFSVEVVARIGWAGRTNGTAHRFALTRPPDTIKARRGRRLNPVARLGGIAV